MRGLAVLDAYAVPPGGHGRGKPVVLFPDLTDTSTPQPGEPEAALAAQLQAFASGRKIVSLVGHLQRSKGLELYTQAVSDPRLSHLCFSRGEISWDGISQQHQVQLKAAWQDAPNLYTHFKRIEEKSLNQVLQVSQVIYAAYVDFPHSSNMLTKSAAFQTPIVVSAGYLMAKQVETYGLGAVVPEGQAAPLVEAILRLTAAPLPAKDNFSHALGCQRIGPGGSTSPGSTLTANSALRLLNF